MLNKKQVYILAGATGTEIYRRGFKTELPLWSAKVLFEKPELLDGIYKDYIAAGADIITTNTFRTQKRTLAKVGLEKEWERINILAADVGRKAINCAKTGRKIYLACSLAPLEDCYEPGLVPEDRELKDEHGEQAELLASAAIDFFLLETFNCIREALAAAEAVKKTQKPFAVSFVVNKDGDLLSGETILDAVDVLKYTEPIAVLVNCARPEYLTRALEKIKDGLGLPFGAYGNGDGEPSEENGWKFNNTDSINQYTAHCRTWKDLGANILGGCCGTNPEYTKAYSKLKFI